MNRAEYNHAQVDYHCLLCAHNAITPNQRQQTNQETRRETVAAEAIYSQLKLRPLAPPNLQPCSQRTMMAAQSMRFMSLY